MRLNIKSKITKNKISLQVSVKNIMEVKAMSPNIDKNVNVLTFAAEEPITDFEMVMAKIEHDAHQSYNGVENIALENEAVKKHHGDEVKQ